MELQDTRFMRFMICFWIDYQKFKGASKVCAILINFFLLLFKLVFCGAILLVLAPYVAASALRNKPHLNILEKILYVLLVVVCIALDIPLLLICVVSIMLTCRFLIDGQLLESLIFGILSWVLIRPVSQLLFAPFCRKAEAHADKSGEEEEKEEEEDVTWYEAEDDIDELVFCQLFTLGKDMCLFIDHIEMCPDETAFIRVVGEERYTPLYKRKVRRDKAGNRFIVFNSTNYYLDDKKTQPIITSK